MIIGVGTDTSSKRYLYDGVTKREVSTISPYLVQGQEKYVSVLDAPIYSECGAMVMGSQARDGGNLFLTDEESSFLTKKYPESREIIKSVLGSQELIHYGNRKCLWIEDEQLDFAKSIPEISKKIDGVEKFRRESKAKTTNGYAVIPHKFAQRAHKSTRSMIVAATSSEKRSYLPADILLPTNVITNAAYAVYDPKMWEFSIVVSKLHYVWVGSICGKLGMGIRYSSTLGWNTFPISKLTEKNKEDLTRCAEDILLAREAHFPATIADLYDPENMPDDLRRAHDRNDEVLERICIGRRFKNDTERLEKLFDLYTRMTATSSSEREKKVN